MRDVFPLILISFFFIFNAYSSDYDFLGIDSKGNPLTLKEGESLTIKNVFDRYPRNRTEETTIAPFKWVGHLGGFCSGTIIGPRHILTAGHCVYSQKKKKFKKKLFFTPGLNGSLKPFEKLKWKYAFSFKGFVKDATRNLDIGLVILEKDLDDSFGFLPLRRNDFIPSLGENLSITGYPGDRPRTTQWTVNCPLDKKEDGILSYLCDTYGGMSGSSILSNDPLTNEPVVIGVHSFGANKYNGGIFLNDKKLSRINEILDSNF